MHTKHYLELIKLGNDRLFRRAMLGSLLLYFMLHMPILSHSPLLTVAGNVKVESSSSLSPANSGSLW